MQDVQYYIFVRPQSDLGYQTTSTIHSYWVLYGVYRSLREAKRVTETLIKKIDADSIMLCKKIDTHMVLEIG